MRSVFKALNPLIIFALFIAINVVSYHGITIQDGQVLEKKEMAQIIIVELLAISLSIFVFYQIHSKFNSERTLKFRYFPSLALLVPGLYSLLNQISFLVFERKGYTMGAVLLEAAVGTNMIFHIFHDLIITTILQELFFRRLMLSIPKTFLGQASALFFSSLAFALIHSEGVEGRLVSIIIGLSLGFLYLKTRNLYACIFSHFMINLTKAGALFLSRLGEHIAIFDKNTSFFSLHFAILGPLFALSIIGLIRLTKNFKEDRRSLQWSRYLQF
ncbi:MAG: type II CAAX endopeptidase family protein [Bacillota bacterium]|nr:type II CAAX endopeptidase family protein [Bacillota bacterium]HHU62243.1 CPBP family intramembrane metalloprotease [Natronincola sp.]